MEGLTEGRIVHFILDAGPNAGVHRPAIIVRVWNKDSGVCNLHVFTDGYNDDLDNTIFPTSVSPDLSENPAHGTWHWIEKA